MDVFNGLGFSLANVQYVSASGLYDSGHTVNSQYSAHPWGTWIKSGTTVYFVSSSGLIPVPDYATFINNGGQDNFVVQANTYDFQKPLLGMMMMGDSRTR